MTFNPKKLYEKSMLYTESLSTDSYLSLDHRLQVLNDPGFKLGFRIISITYIFQWKEHHEYP